MKFFITSLANSDRYIQDIYLNGSCYQFHLLLKKFAPSSEARINITQDHIVTLFKGKYFDITGEVKGFFEPLSDLELRKAKKWSFHKHNLIQITECPACDEPIVV